MKGILDRIEKDKAVILLEEIKKEVILPLSALPKGSKEQTVFNMEEKEGEYVVISIDEQTTTTAAKKSAELMKKLRAKSKGSKFKK